MASSGMLRCVALVRIDVSEELSASFIRVTRIADLGTMLATINRRTLRKKILCASRSLLRSLVTANVPNMPILVTLMMMAIRSS
jgi:hypothetical protein